MGTKRSADDSIAAIGDGILRLLVGGGVLGLILIAPNAVKMLDKPLRKYLEELDERSRERELRRALYYLKRQGLVSGPARGYDHGLQITAAGRSRLRAVELNRLAIARPKRWDERWRLVLYDIPEEHAGGRRALISRLKILGFYPLQRSVLVHPYPCRREIEVITVAYSIERYVSYIETDHIDQEDLLIKKFRDLLD